MHFKTFTSNTLQLYNFSFSFNCKF